MPLPHRGVAVRLAPTDSWLDPDAPGVPGELLVRSGIAPGTVRPPGQAEVELELFTPAWDGLNLAALVAAARATPGIPVHLGTPPQARALSGVMRESSQPRILDSAGTPPTVAILDRDGTIIEDRGYLADPDGLTLLPGAADGLRRLQQAGVPLVVVTNQSGVASGRVSPAALQAVHERLVSLLLATGVTLAGIYTCPHAPDAGCECRKPGAALVRLATAEHRLDLAGAVVAGDKAADLGLARRLDATAFLVTTGEGAATLAAGSARPDYVVDGLDHFALICCHPAGLPRPRST